MYTRTDLQLFENLFLEMKVHSHRFAMICKSFLGDEIVYTLRFAMICKSFLGDERLRCRLAISPANGSRLSGGDGNFSESQFAIFKKYFKRIAILD